MTRTQRRPGLGNRDSLQVSLLDYDSDQPQVCTKAWCWQRVKGAVDIGTVSLMVMVLFGIAGVTMHIVIFAGSEKCTSSGVHRLTCYVLSFALFGFAGGFTNWLAIFMLFQRVPFLYGSGVIPNRYKQIRETVHQVVLEAFFEEQFVQRYMLQKVRGIAASTDIPSRIQSLLASDEVDSLIERKLADLQSQPEGQLLTTVGLQPAQLKPMIKPFIVSTGAEMAPAITDSLANPKKSHIQRLRNEVDQFMREQLQKLSEKHVTAILERVIRPHLGWLILWGSVFGAVIGLIVQAVGLGPDY